MLFYPKQGVKQFQNGLFYIIFTIDSHKTIHGCFIMDMREGDTINEMDLDRNRKESNRQGEEAEAFSGMQYTFFQPDGISIMADSRSDVFYRLVMGCLPGRLS